MFTIWLNIDHLLTYLITYLLRRSCMSQFYFRFICRTTCTMIGSWKR